LNRLLHIEIYYFDYEKLFIKEYNTKFSNNNPNGLNIRDGGNHEKILI
jgi:hypothetical protein